jgi:hypothetical protein
MGVSGKCDIVEVEFQPARNAEALRAKRLYPVEFKLGKRRRWENDDVQLCAQALCLEEMFGVEVARSSTPAANGDEKSNSPPICGGAQSRRRVTCTVLYAAKEFQRPSTNRRVKSARCLTSVSPE